MKAFLLRMDDELHERLADYAHVKRDSMNNVVRAAVEHYLDLHDTQAGPPVLRRSRLADDRP